MFVGEQVPLNVSFCTARARLATIAHGSLLLSVSLDAYGEGITGLVRVGPLGAAPVVSRLVEVQFRDLVTRGDSVVLTLRWNAIGSGGRLFPALDADIALSPDGDDASMLAMTGAYRPPLGALGAAIDRAILHRAAEATIRHFVGRIAAAIADPAAVPEPVPDIADLHTSRLPLAAEEPMGIGHADVEPHPDGAHKES